MKFRLWLKRLRMTQGAQKSPRNRPPMKIQLLLTFDQHTKNLEKMKMNAPRNPSEPRIWPLVIWLWIRFWFWTWTWLRFLSEALAEPRMLKNSNQWFAQTILGLNKNLEPIRLAWTQMYQWYLWFLSHSQCWPVPILLNFHQILQIVTFLLRWSPA